METEQLIPVIIAFLVAATGWLKSHTEVKTVQREREATKLERDSKISVLETKVSELEHRLDAAFANGDWLVFGTHSYQFTTSEDTTDPNANTLGNLKELMQYAITKGLEFRTLWDAYNRRKYLFEFKEINQ